MISPPRVYCINWSASCCLNMAVRGGRQVRPHGSTAGLLKLSMEIQDALGVQMKLLTNEFDICNSVPARLSPICYGQDKLDPQRMASELCTQNAVLHQEWLTNCHRAQRFIARVNYVNKDANPRQIQCQNPGKRKALFII
jgi:hypothetical protein